MQDILLSLQELDRLYQTDTLAAYERLWQAVAQQVRLLFPGFTIAYAELYIVGSDREAHGGMRHVLSPSEHEPSARIVCGTCPDEY